MSVFRQSRCRLQCVLSLVVGCLLATPSDFVAAQDASAEYRAAVEARAAKAEQSGDAIQMIEAAFALYPLDAQKGAEKPRSAALVNKAVDVTLEKKDRALAGKVLELSSPLSGQIAADKKQRLDELVAGKSITDQVDQEAGKVAPNLKKYGPDLGDPKIKGRGNVEKDIAETLGMAVLVFCRPTAPLSDQKPSMTSYQFERSGASRITLTVKIRYYGVYTGNPYDAKVKIKFMVDDCLEILSITYDDDNLVPVGTIKYMDRLVDKLNELLCK